MEVTTWVNLYFHGNGKNIVTVAKNPAWPAATVAFEKYGKHDTATMLQMMHTLMDHGYSMHSMDVRNDGTVSSATLVRAK